MLAMESVNIQRRRYLTYSQCRRRSAESPAKRSVQARRCPIKTGAIETEGLQLTVKVRLGYVQVRVSVRVSVGVRLDIGLYSDFFRIFPILTVPVLTFPVLTGN